MDLPRAVFKDTKGNMNLKLAIILGSILSLHSFATNDYKYLGKIPDKYPDGSPQALVQLIKDEYIDRLKDRSHGTTIYDVVRASSEDRYSQTGQACENLYRGLYDNDEIDFRLYFGYKNFTPDAPIVLPDGRKTKAIYTQDVQIKLAIAHTLLTPCDRSVPEFRACGFSKVPIPANLQRTEEIIVGGKKSKVVKKYYDNYIQKAFTDPYGRKRVYKLLLVHSSLWRNNDAKEIDPMNLPVGGAYNPGQALQVISQAQSNRSAAVKAEFLNSFHTADIVFYNGHSRKGGGPDFFPPYSVMDTRSSEYLQTDYSYYEDLKLRYELINTVRGSSRAPKFIGLFSCDSKRHFYKQLNAAAANTNFIFNFNPSLDEKYGDKAKYRSFWKDEPITFIGAINAVLSGFCQTSFNGSMYSSRIDPRSMYRMLPAR